MIDWGDNYTEVVKGLFESGEEIMVNHTWNQKGNSVRECWKKNGDGHQ